MTTMVTSDSTPKRRPPGAGLGDCPAWKRGVWNTIRCGCGAPKCAVCGFDKHSGVHMHCAGELPGDPPWGHEYKPEDER